MSCTRTKCLRVNTNTPLNWPPEPEQTRYHSRGGAPAKLHGEVSRVVVFYRGNDRLNELEENQKIPESQGLREKKNRDAAEKIQHQRMI